MKYRLHVNGVITEDVILLPATSPDILRVLKNGRYLMSVFKDSLDANKNSRSGRIYVEVVEEEPLSDQALADEYFRVSAEIAVLSKERGSLFTAICDRGYKVVLVSDNVKFTKTIPPAPSEPIVIELLPPSS